MSEIPRDRRTPPPIDDDHPAEQAATKIPQQSARPQSGRPPARPPYEQQVLRGINVAK
jgi:hypothetical protein